MDRRNFLLNFLIWVLAFFFGYKVKEEGNNMVLSHQDTKKMIVKDDGKSNLEQLDFISNRIKWISVEEFGAKGDYYLPDGSRNPNPTDDTIAIQRAFDSPFDIVNDPNKTY